MEILIRKELKWRTAALITLAAFALSFLTIPYLGISSMFIIAPLSILTWTITIVYLVQYFPLIPNLRRLDRIGLNYVADDISEHSRMSAKSKLYYGAHAIACTNPCVVIPYSEIAWVYIHEEKMYGVVTTYQAAIIYCTDGKKYSISATPDEIKWLLAQYIIPQSPNIVIGYGSQQKKLYLSRNPQAVQARKTVLSIWGIVLLLLGALMAVGCVLGDSVKVAAYILTASMLAASAILLLLGKK